MRREEENREERLVRLRTLTFQIGNEVQGEVQGDYPNYDRAMRLATELKDTLAEMKQLQLKITLDRM